MRARRLLAAGVVLLVGTGSACSQTPRPDDSTAEQPERPGASAAPVPDQPDRPDRRAQPDADVPDPLARAMRRGPERATRPSELAAQIVASEDAVADPRSDGALLATAGHVQQVAYRQLGKRPAWDAAVRAQVPPRLRSVVRDNVASRREFRSMHGELSETLPAWRIVRPASPRTLMSAYRAAQRRFGVGWEYLAAINLVETGMGRIRGASVAGARGPMQFIPETWAASGRGDINSPRDAIAAAGRYLSARGFARPRGIPGALYAYNNSTSYVRGVSLLARVMERRPRAFLGYYHWQIYYLSREGDVLLPEGYTSRRPIPVTRYLADNPR